jgi:hypothetical protein
VTITGLSSPAQAGQTAQLTATASLSDGTTQAVTSQATWASSAEAVATVSASGMATFVAAGDADIRATYRSVTGTSRVTVMPVLSRYSLEGVVSDAANNRGVENARVELVDGPDAGRSTQTDAAGAYRITGIVAGHITVRVTHPQFVNSDTVVTLSSDTRLNVALRARVDVRDFYGTFNVRFTIAAQTCEFPITPGPAGQLILSGGTDGTNFQAKIIERGTTRTYGGVMQQDGHFAGSGGGPLPGLGPVVNKHDFTGTIDGRVSGSFVASTENIVYEAPCPGKIATFNLNGNR